MQLHEALAQLPRRTRAVGSVIPAITSSDDGCQRIADVAPSIDSVLVRAESGAGKEVVAKEIHAQSSRKAGELVIANCASLNAPTAEAELFGYVKGAFTGADRDKEGLFQRAHRGTLFLDELGELKLPAQVNLLRALQGGKVRPVGGVEEITVSVRVVAATNQNLEEMVSRGQFRIELLSRFVEQLQVPALHERLEDIPDLVAHFIEVLRGQEGRNSKAKRITKECLAKLQAHRWTTNNVRELETAVKRALNRSRESAVEDLGPELFQLESPIVGEGDPKQAAAAALRKAAEAILSEIESEIEQGTRTAAPPREISEQHPELDLAVQLAFAFDTRSFENRAEAARALFGYADADAVRAIIRRAEKKTKPSGQPRAT